MKYSALIISYALSLNLFFTLSPQANIYPDLFPKISSTINRSVLSLSPSYPIPTNTPTVSVTPVITPILTPEPTSVPTPQPIPTTQPTPIPTPIFIKTPSPTSVPILTPTPSPIPSSKTDSFIKRINDYRSSFGLSSVGQDPYSCNFAQIRAQEIATSFNHDGFTSRMNNKTLPYPGYRLVIENIAMNSNPSDVVNQWINSSGHAANLKADILYACVAGSGNYYAFEGWKP